MDFVRFVHFLGSCMWIGGAAAAWLLAVNAASESVHVKAALFRLLTQAQTLIVGVGALLTLGTGVMWSMALAKDGGVEGGGATLGTWIMEGTGLVGGILVLVVVVPTSVKLGGLAVTTDEGEMLPAFEYYRRRLMTVSLIAGLLALVSLLTGVVL
jgi:uncharacterized membrane protein